jgi:hypothetical protein
MNLSNVIVLDVYANRPAAGIAGRLFFASDTLRVYRDSGAAWADATPGGAVRVYSATITAQTSVAITHALGTLNVIVQVFDDGGLSNMPETCTIVDANHVALSFGAAFTGKVVVLG